MPTSPAGAGTVACSAEPGDAVLLGGAHVGVGPEGSGAVCLGKVPEKALESGGRGEDQYAPGPRRYPPLGVRDTARSEHEPAGGGLELLVADLEDVLPFEHVEQLVLVPVNMERRVDGFVLLKDRAHLHRQICDREAAVFAQLEAAAGADPEATQVLAEHDQRRYETHAG
jgi:hypothetical protein